MQKAKSRIGSRWKAQSFAETSEPKLAAKSALSFWALSPSWAESFSSPDKDVQGLTAIIAAFVALAGVFIYGRWQQQQERARKRQEAADAAAAPRLPFESGG